MEKPKNKGQKVETKPARTPDSGYPVELTLPQYVRSEALRELFEVKDGELPLKTRTPGRCVIPFTMMEVIENALSGDGLKPSERPRLSTLFRKFHDQRMISIHGQSRKEMMMALTAIARAEEEEEIGI